MTVWRDRSRERTPARHDPAVRTSTPPTRTHSAPTLKRHKPTAVVSGLPYYCNVAVAEVARELGLHYFDLTEDVAVTEAVRKIAEGAEQVFAPQCGLAPGFISIAANELISHFDTVRSVKLRVGALPQHPNNVLKYSLTWSTDGVINEYGNLCNAIVDGQGSRRTAARRPRGNRDRRQTLRSVQHLGRPRLTGRELWRPGDDDELQDDSLSRVIANRYGCS